MNNINNTSKQQSPKDVYFDEKLKQTIIKKARQNERYRLPLHANYYKWGKEVDIRPYLPYFAGIGIEKLYLFYTHILQLLDIYCISNGKFTRWLYCDRDNKEYDLGIQIWKDMLMMVEDLVFVRKLQKLRYFTEDDFKRVEFYEEFGCSLMDKDFDIGSNRKQLLFFLVDIAINALRPIRYRYYSSYQEQVYNPNVSGPIKQFISYQIFGAKFPKEDITHAFKTVYTRKVKIPNINNNNDINIYRDSFLYELKLKKIDDHRQRCDIINRAEKFKKLVMNKLEPLITKEKETQTEEPVLTKDEQVQTEEQVQTDTQIKEQTN